MAKRKRHAERFLVSLSSNKYAIYAPRKGIYAVVNKEFVQKINSKDSTVRCLKDFIDHMPSAPNSRNSIKLSGLALSLTSDCNMRCRYCYARGGDQPGYMAWPVAKTAIDYAIEHSGKNFRLIFQGAGESTLAFDMMRRCYNYAKLRCKQPHKVLKISITTNGVVAPNRLKWFQELGPNLDLSVSFDGLPQLQNIQRPLKTGGPSYAMVTKTMKMLNDHNISYTVRTGITDMGVRRIPAIIRHLHALGAKRLLIGPIDNRGRCATTGNCSPDQTEYLHQFVKSCELMRKLGMKLVGFWPEGLKNNCGLCGPFMVVTTDGHISACCAVLDTRDPAAGLFLYGRITSGHVKINKKKERYLKNRTIHNIAACRKCFAKWNCGGGCAVDALNRNGSIYSPGTTKCERIKMAVKNMFEKNHYC